MPVRLPHVDTRDEATRRRPIYADLEELVVPGFLSQQVTVAGVRLGLRSLSPGDYTLLRGRIGEQSSVKSWKEWVVATSVWMVNGQTLFGDANAAVPVKSVLTSLPLSALDILFSVHVALHNRVASALRRLEAYCYEDHSRLLWRMVGRKSPARDDVAGVPGVSTTGMNHAQRLWVAFNIAEDDRHVWQQEWAAAKLTASASSPKGIRKLNQRDESERKLEAEQRQRAIARVYHEATGHQVGEESGVVMRRSVTPEELVDEMSRWVRGEKDWHDQVIGAYKDKIREKHESDRVRHEARMREVEELSSEVGAVGGAFLVGHTLEQLQDIRGSVPGGFQRRGTSVVTSANQHRIYEKYVAQDIPAGGFTEQGAVAFPSAEDSSDLTRVVASRKVRLGEHGVLPRDDGGV